ncbi:hypothetical protein HanIR_Chr03g0131951 [Helianthus annuus]|nr:hypothetical protein HanIR_Chr03g0131951 [Helianthus annuus]
MSVSGYLHFGFPVYCKYLRPKHHEKKVQGGKIVSSSALVPQQFHLSSAEDILSNSAYERDSSLNHMNIGSQLMFIP